MIILIQTYECVYRKDKTKIMNSWRFTGIKPVWKTWIILDIMPETI